MDICTSPKRASLRGSSGLLLAIGGALVTLAACYGGNGCGMGGGSGYSIHGGTLLDTCTMVQPQTQSVDPSNATSLTSSLNNNMSINGLPMFYSASTPLPAASGSVLTLGLSGATTVTGGTSASYTVSITPTGTITTLFCNIAGATGSLSYPGYGLTGTSGTLSISWPTFSQAVPFTLQCAGQDNTAKFTVAATLVLSAH